jgi:calpain-15
MMGDHVILQWLDHLGYDQDLFSIRSRCFIFTLHSIEDVSVTVRDAVQTDLDARTCLLIIDKFGMV